MLLLGLIGALTATSCHPRTIGSPGRAAPETQTAASHAFSQHEDQRAGVRAALRAMESAWNSGNFDEFMNAYWNSPNLTFFSNGRKLDGHTTLARVMRERYAQGMGRISFGEPHFGVLGPDFAVIWGEWRLQLPTGGTRNGVGTAVFRYLDGRWRVVHDHTSFVDSPPRAP
jgi:uncharacterized protein (TIGR02246 family)